MLHHSEAIAMLWVFFFSLYHHPYCAGDHYVDASNSWQMINFIIMALIVFIFISSNLQIVLAVLASYYKGGKMIIVKQASGERL